MLRLSWPRIRAVARDTIRQPEAVLETPTKLQAEAPPEAAMAREILLAPELEAQGQEMVVDQPETVRAVLVMAQGLDQERAVVRAREPSLALAFRAVKREAVQPATLPP
jgi:hypothetical protein